MNDAENKILEHIYKYDFRKSSYENMLKTFAEQDKKPIVLHLLIEKLSRSINAIRNFWMVTPEEERAFKRKLELRALGYYQRALEKNYEMLKQYKETGEEPADFEYLVMTVDKDGNPKKTRVIDVENGEPVFEDGCEIVNIRYSMTRVYSLSEDLYKWIDRNDTLQQKLEKALALKEKGRLGGETPPSPNYDTSGMSREQSDAQAWQNYAIEMGMVRVVNYDYALKEFIFELERCIEFYKKATSIL
ncbi:MAG: hypothetical protein IJX27_04050 [Clostridia bacterium]|nr:hypothetical protein [Clostridia bacterium]